MRAAFVSVVPSPYQSDLFHALRGGDRFVCPVSAGATIWAESVVQCADNLVHALSLDSALLPPGRAVTLPALRPTMGALAAEIAAQCGVSPGLVEYAPDAALEAAFGAQPPLATPAAERAGFAHDGSLGALVRRALAHIVQDAG